MSISAPGENVASAYPGGQYLSASGTSMAAPMVSGSVVLMLERFPEATPDDVSQMLFENSTALSLSDPLLEGLMGSGNLNIDAAIDCEAAGTGHRSLMASDSLPLVEIRLH